MYDDEEKSICMYEDDVYQTPTTAVAVDKDKNSQQAAKWTVEHLAVVDEAVALVHVKTPETNHGHGHETMEGNRRPMMDEEYAAFFHPFRVFFARKGVKVVDVVLENSDVAFAIDQYVMDNEIRKIVVGASNKNAITRKIMGKPADVPTTLLKITPEFCSVYVILKEKVLNVRKATRDPPSGRASVLATPRLQMTHASHHRHSLYGAMEHEDSMMRIGPTMSERMTHERSAEYERMITSPSTWNTHHHHDHQHHHYRHHGHQQHDDHHHSHHSHQQHHHHHRHHPNSVATPKALHHNYDYSVHPPSCSSRFHSPSDESDFQENNKSANSFRSSDLSDCLESSSTNGSSLGSSSSASQVMDSHTRELEVEMNKLKMELKDTRDLYKAACKEALSARQWEQELYMWKMYEARILEEVKHGEEAAIAMAEMQKRRYKAAIEAIRVARRKAKLEMQRRKKAEREAEEEKKKAMENSLAFNHRNYSIEEIERATNEFSVDSKIGEGGYGSVYKGHLDHTLVAVKVLGLDAALGRKQFHEEVEVLSCIRHPNMVLLLGACPEYGCLVYEYMENGSLDDRLFCRNGTPPISWQLRIKIAEDIATGLLFLHHFRPEPLIHRDLKPGNILLDRNYVAKISDVGLARLVPPKVADTANQYQMASAAGTFCYVDPECQMTGMLEIKSDVYSFGILLLQLITGKPPMGLARRVSNAIEEGTFEAVLDPTVKDWPVEEAMALGKLALSCAGVRRKDRPDLGTVVLPELERLSSLT